MSKTLLATIVSQFAWVYEKRDDVSGRMTTDRNAISSIVEFSNGTGANQANVEWAKRGSILSGASEDIDVAGVLEDSFGDVVTLARVKGLCIASLSTSAGSLIVGNGPNPFASWLAASNDAILLPAGGVIQLCNPSAEGYVVTAGTGDILRLTASGGDVDYDIGIIGAAT